MAEATPTPSSPAAPAPSAPVAAASVAASAPASPTPTPTPAPATPAPAAAPTSARPTDLPEAFWDAEKNVLNVLKVNEIATRDAAEQIRRASLPTKADDVKVELPKDFPLPQGVEFKIDPTKPEFSKLRELAVKRGLDQDTVSDLIGVYAETQVRDAAGFQTAKNAEIAKLGANGPVRVGAIETFLTGFVGEADAKALGSMMVTANIVTAFEKMVAKFSSQGAAPFSQAHRDVRPQGRVSEDEYQRMSPAQRLDYTRQFDQSQFQKAS